MAGSTLTPRGWSFCVTSLQGHDSTCGLAQFLEKPAAKDGVIVKVLKAQGAIPFVKTNISQTLLRSLQQAGQPGLGQGPGPGLGLGPRLGPGCSCR